MEECLMSDRIKYPFMTVGFMENGRVSMSLDCENLVALDDKWFGVVLASMTRGIADVLRQQNDLGKGATEQIEAAITESYLESMRTEGGESAYRE